MDDKFAAVAFLCKQLVLWLLLLAVCDTRGKGPSPPGLLETDGKSVGHQTAALIVN
jgi:hypothetical protein